MYKLGFCDIKCFESGSFYKSEPNRKISICIKYVPFKIIINKDIHQGEYLEDLQWQVVGYLFYVIMKDKYQIIYHRTLVKR